MSMSNIVKSVLETVDGNVEVLHIGSSHARNKYLLTAGKHGGEIESVYVLNILLAHMVSKAYPDAFFTVIPNMNPKAYEVACFDFSVNMGSVADKVAIRNKHRTNAMGQNLNRGYPPGSQTPTPAQTALVEELHNDHGYGCMLDFHSHMYTRYTSYICDNPKSVSIARKLNDVNGCRWALECYDGERLSGCPGEYYASKGVHFITVELGVVPTNVSKIEGHMKRISQEQRSAMDWLFRQKLSRFK